MTSLDHDVDARTALTERRWFAAIRAARDMESECDVLREVLVAAEDAWRRARARLIELETLRDALGEQLLEREALRPEIEPPPRACLRSAAA